MTGPLPPLDVAARMPQVLAMLPEVGCDGLLVTGLANIRWLTGFSGSAARLVLLPGDAVLVTDGRYGDQAAAEAAAVGAPVRVVVGRTQPEQAERLREVVGPLGRLGLEAAHVSWAHQRAYAEAFPSAVLVPTTGLVERHRLVKDAAEVARIERAAAIASAALEVVVPLFDGEPTEADVAVALEAEMRRLGADAPAFETIVATGPNAALPHHRPGPDRLRAGQLVVLDFGAAVDGYRSDMTRTAVLGTPQAALAELLAVATLAQAAGVAAVAAGVDAVGVDRACRDAVAAAGLADCFTHGTGHGVGLEIHEAPWLNATSTDVLPAGAVVTVEPGVYRFGLGGARVEDTVLVTAGGCRPLTTTPKDLSCLRSPRTT